jgi:hypothetical protein
MTNLSRTDSSNYPEAVIDEVIQQGRKWQVRFRAWSWTARSARPLNLFPGDTVQVTQIGHSLVIDIIDSF